MVEEAMRQFCEEAVKLGYEPVLASEQEQGELDAILRRNGIDPVQYPVRTCYFFASPRLAIFSSHGATRELAEVELRILGEAVIKDKEGVRLIIEVRDVSMGQKIVNLMELIPSGGEVRADSPRAVIRVGFAKPPVKEKTQ